MEPVNLFRIVVASPGDVQAERDALPAVLEELNRGLAATQNLRLELGRWETDAYPGFHLEGPQGLIDPILRIEDCDVLLGIFWKRFGTPTADAGSASAASGVLQRPRPPRISTSDHGNAQHLGTATAPEPTEDLRAAYLTWLMEQVRAVPLTGVDPKSIREETRRDLDLAAVYTALMTQRTERAEERALRPDREVQHLSALAVLNTEPHLALLGDPGSGKSTFVNFVALCMAGELCHHPDANLRVLTAPVPADDSASRHRGAEKPQPQPWDHGALLPLRVVLREFVARGLPHTSQPATVLGDSLWQLHHRRTAGNAAPFRAIAASATPAHRRSAAARRPR